MKIGNRLPNLLLLLDEIDEGTVTELPADATAPAPCLVVIYDIEFFIPSPPFALSDVTLGITTHCSP